MTIEMLNRRTILVSLKTEDMREYDLCFDADTEAASKGLKALLCHVGELCGLNPDGKSYLIEALPAKEGCLLIISVHRTKRRVYRVKRRPARALCVFFHVDAMLDYCRLQKDRAGYSIWLYEGRYVLLDEAGMNDGALGQLSEFGELHAVSPAVQARVREYGKLLLEKSLQRRHVGGRAVAVRDAAPGSAGG